MQFDTATIEQIKDILISRKETIAVAESVTSGLMQGALSGAEFASDFFEGGITTYNIDQKVKHLMVNRQQAADCNCVSPDIAKQMALGVIALFESTWGLSVTGYSTPVEESDFKVYAHFAIARNKQVVHVSKIELEIKGEEAQLEYVNTIMREFLKTLSNTFNFQQAPPLP